MSPARVAVFGPSPLLAVTVGSTGAVDTVTVDAGGQAAWVLRAAAATGARTVLCAAAGGPVATAVWALLGVPDVDLQVVPTSACGCYVTDVRGRHPVSMAVDWAPAQVRALLAVTAQAARGADVLVVANPMPGDALPADTYAEAVALGRRAGALVVVDLSSPRLDAALAGGPDVVKINDWELAEAVAGPVPDTAARWAAIDGLLARGAGSVVVTRGSGTVLAAHSDGERAELRPPTVGGPGTAAGCGDAMTGVLAGSLAAGTTWRQAVECGVAAGSVHYRTGGTPTRSQVDELVGQVSGPG